MINIYQTVTNRVLAQLKAGVVPWHKSWTSGLPKSLTTGKEYRGVNILLLSTAHHNSRYWTTYREAQRLGGHVKKGERATPVVFWKWRTAEDLHRLKEKTGKKDFSPCTPFYSAVFNLDQVEGVSRPEDDATARHHDSMEEANRVVEPMPDKPTIQHAAAYTPAYVPALDRVTMPGLQQFESARHYYAALFHELVHSTGHAKRLNRFANKERDCVRKYSFEELVAEFGAAFLCGFAGIETPATATLQASYIEGWSRVFEQDSRVLVRAAAAAQRAVDYIRGNAVSERATEAAS